MLFAVSGANCFSVMRSTRLRLFIMLMPSYNSVPGAPRLCYVILPCEFRLLFVICLWISQSHCYFDLILSPLPSAPPLHRASPYLSLISGSLSLCPFPLLFQCLVSLLASLLHFYTFSNLFTPVFPLYSVLPDRRFASVSSLPHCHQLLYTEQRVITFVLHHVSLIGSVPPSSATSAEKEIEAFCHV